MVTILAWTLISPGSVMAREPTRSATETDYPPFCVVDGEGRASGFSVELLRAALTAMDREVSFRVGPWSEVRGWLARGEVQALPLVGRTPEREDIFDFTFPYMSLHGAIVVREGTQGIGSLDDLRGKQVAVMKGDNAEEFLRREERGITIHTTLSFEEALRELADGRHDAVVTQRLVALRLIQEGGLANLRVINRPLEEFRQDFGFAVKKGDHATLALLNEGLALVIADGTFRALHAKWFAALELPSHRPLVIGGDHSYPPFEYLDEQGLPAGYNVDLTRAIAREMGLNVEIRLGPWGEIRRALATGEIDALQGMFYSHERNRSFDFTQPHLIKEGVAVVRRGEGAPPVNLAELVGKRIVVQTGDIMHDFALENGLGQWLTAVDGPEQALRELALGRHDCALVSRLSAHYWISEQGWNNLLVGHQPLLSSGYCYAVAKGNQALLAQLSEGLKVLADTGEYRRIHQQWMGVYEDSEFTSGEITRYVAMVAGPLLLLILIFFLWSWSLRKRVAERTAELRESESFVRMVMDHLPVGISVNSVDPTVKFSYMNDNFPRFYRTTREALISGDFWESVYEDPRFREEIRQRVLADCASGDPERMHWDEVPITRRGRETSYITARNVPIPGKGLMASMVWDVTERVRAAGEREKLQEQLLQARKMESVGQLAGGVAHDFNNMLSVIMGYTEMAIAEMDPDDRLCGDLHEIRNAAERSANITRQLLAFARRQIIAPEVLDLNERVGSTLKMLRRLIGEDIELAWLPGAGVWPIKIDPSQLDQLLANLCVNARDAIAGVGKITIESQNVTFDEAYCAHHQEAVLGDFTLLMVSDDGRGMERSVREHIFEPFFSTKGVGEGTGLGLATVYGIVKQNEGFINVYSEPGKGTTFKICLPRHPGDADELAVEDSRESPRAQGETVLLVEDERAILRMGQKMLEKLGYRVLAAGSPREALALVGGHSGGIELLITDVVMPGMNGRELAEKLLGRYPNLKVLYMSGYTANVIAHRGVLDEGVHFIPKPFAEQELAVKVRLVLDSGRSGVA
ncbi:MAG TPA: transporter substrate-binding domain-containing protein [Desulfurivibrio alkaliphilus]|uniref:histidine kinase n=1 Tax=Desulfurivibrio alkaliphilus TaxID=427923 RepID=A0A7C2XMU4_9BACT|nr:transporter substrate-binding domain-containing protein [Desulfurivibrio alkaliphilus]